MARSLRLQLEEVLRVVVKWVSGTGMWCNLESRTHHAAAVHIQFVHSQFESMS